jgi:hypothetical protein
MTSDQYFRGPTGTRYTYAEIADRIRNEAPHMLGKHISVQLEAIGLLEEMQNGTTPCSLPFTFAEAECTPGPWENGARVQVFFTKHGYTQELWTVFSGKEQIALVGRGEDARLIAATPAKALMLDLIRYGLLSLGDGEVESQGMVYAFDDRRPDWNALVNAIGWDKARAAIAEAKAAGIPSAPAAAKLLASLKAVLPYAESEAYSLEKLKDSPEADAEADRAWKSIETAQAVIAAAEEAGISPAAAEKPARFEFTHEPEENPDRAYVLVDGKFDVKIIRTAERIVIEVYPEDSIDPIETMTVWDDEEAELEQDAAEEPGAS